LSGAAPLLLRQEKIPKGWGELMSNQTLRTTASGRSNTNNTKITTDTKNKKQTNKLKQLFNK
jgi:hypothetical protein